MMNKNNGFSMIELLVVIAIVGIITTMAVPAFSRMIERNKLKSAVQSLQDDLQFARTQAIKQSRNILIRQQKTSAAAGSWCYGISVNASCNCDPNNDNNSADSTCEIKTVSGSGFNTVKMFSNSGNNTVDFRRGTIGNDGVTFSTPNYAARVNFSFAGRVKICTPPTVSDTVAADNRPTGTIGLPTTPNC